MKVVRIYTGDDNESHVEPMDGQSLPFDPQSGRTANLPAYGVQFASRKVGFRDFHGPPRKQYMIYLTAQVEIGLGDGSSVVMEPGDVLQAEDTTGHGHTSKVLRDGLCMVVRLEE